MSTRFLPKDSDIHLALITLDWTNVLNQSDSASCLPRRHSACMKTLWAVSTVGVRAEDATGI